jgi:hypothetical protein
MKILPYMWNLGIIQNLKITITILIKIIIIQDLIKILIILFKANNQKTRNNL